LGSSLYKVGATSSFVRERAKATVEAYDRIFAG
jgi:2-dehydro-3-deoxyphosphogalactonate aldolase